MALDSVICAPIKFNQLSQGRLFVAQPLSDVALDQIFRTARTYRRSADAWLPKHVDDAQLRQAYDLAKLGPTSANVSPGRIVFVRSAEAKEKLKRTLSPSNVPQTMAAPVTAIVGSDQAFYEALPRLYKEDSSAIHWFAGKPDVIEATAFRNSSLQGAYLIIALRALGLDCGPMSGFNNALVDELFFAGTTIKSNFLINIGYGNPAVIRPREERYDFDEACRIV
jgi:3-hydroxypropanoate dehydrogenase